MGRRRSWSSQEARVYRRRLPHWRLDGATYFVTWRLADRQGDLTAMERDLVAGVVRHFSGARFSLHAFVIMNDHVHVLLTPHGGERLERLVHSWKSYSAKLLRQSGRSGQVWLGEYFDRIVRDRGELEEKLRYIATNPILRWPLVGSYRWVWVDPHALD